MADPFESVRAIAAKLHADLIVAGTDASQPVAFIQAAISSREIELVWLSATDPVLKGAQALYDEQSGTICCADEGDDVTRASRLAHELGHACVHTISLHCAGADIDPSRSTEAAPVGLQRVEDYGGHERRELQANVFARELLLPRPEARRLHVDERLGATVIAECRKLPKDLVRQQLLDALLLPAEPPERTVPRRASASPEPSQERAARHTGSAFQLQAGPGTGKTHTLVRRALALLADRVDPAAILVLTFSNRAAGELYERISEEAPDAAPKIWIGTFHAFGLDLIRRYYEQLDLPADPPLLDRSDGIGLLEEILPTLPLTHYRNLWDPVLVLRDIVAAISRAKDELVDPARYQELADAMLARAGDEESRIAASKAREVADVYHLYDEELRRRGAVDFGDLIMRPAVLLEHDEALRQVLQLRHRHVLVDEYQDINRASARLLRALAGDGRRLWVVGDSRQSIYRFRGASSANKALFSDDYPGAKADRLEVNYRSSAEIVGAFSAVAGRMGASKGMLQLALTAFRGPSRVLPQLRRFDSPDQEAEGVAASITELAAVGVSLRDQVVLCRSNARLNEMATALEARGISVLHLGSLFERSEVRDLLALMTLAVDRFGNGLARVGAMARYDVPLQEVYTATTRMRETPRPASEKLGDVISAGELSPAGARGLAQLQADLTAIAEYGSCWDFLTTYLLDSTDMLAELARRDTVKDRMQGIAIWQFINFARDPVPGGSAPPIVRMLDRIRILVLLAEERDLRYVPTAAAHIDAVRLMTVHASKGLEFEAVHLPGMTVAGFPASARGERCPPPDGMIEKAAGAAADKDLHDHEEECLFFVAISRARTHLRLYAARKMSNGRNRTPSPYLAWFPSSLLDEVASPAMPSPPAGGGGNEPVSLHFPVHWDVDSGGISLYERCPRRFFYTHVLNLGAAQQPTAFSGTHGCLRDFAAWLVDARVTAAVDPDTAAAEFERIWQAKGPVAHAFAREYRAIADRLVAALMRLGTDVHFRASEALVIELPSGRVVIKPDEMAERRDGTTVVRRVRTGSRRKDEVERLEYSLYQLAAREKFGERFALEVLHLADEDLEVMQIPSKTVESRRVKASEFRADIAAGRFPPKLDAVACPRCPHFFICAATPAGPLSLA